MKPISSAQLLGELAIDHLRLTELMPEATVQSEIRAYIDVLNERFEEIIANHGDAESSKEMDALCVKLDTAATLITASNNMSEHPLAKRLTLQRQKIRRRLEIAAGWRMEPPVSNGKPTSTGLEGLNLLRTAIGESPLHLHNTEYLTAEELRASLAIAKMLGDVAVADFWSAVAPDRFDFNNHTIKNLRTWLGDVQMYAGNVFEDIPVQLLTLPSLQDLRDLLFASLRDEYYSKYYKDSLSGVDPVIEKLTDALGTVQSTEHMTFINELIDYFIQVDNLPCPSRLKPGLGLGDEFPGKHQKIAMQEIKKQRQLLLADPTGGGKTGSCIATFEHLRDEGLAKRMLVICPSGIVTEWQKRLTDKKGGYFVQGQKPKVVVIRSKDEHREQTWEEAKTADYVIMSIEMSRRETAGENHVDRAREIGADFYVVDEAHNVRNPKGNDVENIFQIGQSESIQNGFTVAASATPVYNTIKDIAAQIRLLNAGQERLNNAEGLPQGIDFSDIKEITRAISQNHTRLVRNLLKRRMLRRSVNDCLPTGTELIKLEPVETPLSPLEQAIYDAILEDPFYSPTEKIHALQCACTHAKEGFNSSGVIGATKYKQILNAILERAEACRAEPGKFSGKIILVLPRLIDARGISRDYSPGLGNNDPLTSDTNSYMLGVLRKELELHDISLDILDGSNSNADIQYDSTNTMLFDGDGAPLTGTRAIIKKFREDDRISVLGVRTDVGGEGIDLSFADETIFACPTSVKSEEDQQDGRNYRKGQKRNVRSQNLIIQNSIERGKWEYAIRKQKVIEDLLNGRPLTAEEMEMLHDETKVIRRGGFLAYEAQTPRQKVTALFNRMFGMGKARIRDMLAADDGARARELAMLYRQVEEHGMQGNNKRLLLGLLHKHMPDLQGRFGDTMNIADIAAGTLGITRALSHLSDCTVHSTDISKNMMEAGAAALEAEGMNAPQTTVCSMDELPYKNESKQIAFHSLALDCTLHNSHKIDKGGGERIHALRELNRVLAPGGIGFIALQSSLFEGMEQFNAFTAVLQKYFGFEVIAEDTGLAQSNDLQDEEPFEGYVITVRKVSKTNYLPATLPADAWLALQFYRKAPRISTYKERSHQTPEVRTPPPGAYHEEFIIGDQTVVHAAVPAENIEKVQHQKRKARYLKVAENIDRLLLQYRSFKDIPTEELLSISLVDIQGSSQDLRNDYFRRLLLHYDGRIANIPIEDISRQSPVVLLKMHDTKKGWYLVLANLDEHSRSGGYGKKYFEEEEFSAKSDAV